MLTIFLIYNSLFIIYFFVVFRDAWILSLLGYIPLIITLCLASLLYDPRMVFGQVRRYALHFFRQHNTTIFRLFFVFGIALMRHEFLRITYTSTFAWTWIFLIIIAAHTLFLGYAYRTKYDEGKNMFFWGYGLGRVGLFVLQLLTGGGLSDLFSTVHIAVVYTTTILLLLGLLLHTIATAPLTYQRRCVARCGATILSTLIQYARFSSLSFFTITHAVTSLIIAGIRRLIVYAPPKGPDPSRRRNYKLSQLIYGSTDRISRYHRRHPLLQQIYTIVHSFPRSYTMTLSAIPIIAVIMTMIVYIVTVLFGSPVWWMDVMYGLNIGLFLLVYLLVKDINYHHQRLRIIVFALLTFGIYGFIIRRWDSSAQSLVTSGMLRNILMAWLAGYLQQTRRSVYFHPNDFFVWIVTIAIASGLTALATFRLPINIAAQFAIIFLYSGAQGSLLSSARNSLSTTLSRSLTSSRNE